MITLIKLWFVDIELYSVMLCSPQMIVLRLICIGIHEFISHFNTQDNWDEDQDIWVSDFLWTVVAGICVVYF